MLNEKRDATQHPSTTAYAHEDLIKKLIEFDPKTWAISYSSRKCKRENAINPVFSQRQHFL